MVQWRVSLRDQVEVDTVFTNMIRLTVLKVIWLLKKYSICSLVEVRHFRIARILREINFFIFSGFPSQSVYVRRGRTSAHFQRHFHNAHHHTENTVREVCKQSWPVNYRRARSFTYLFIYLQPSGFAALIQLMPILIVIFLSVVSSLLVSDPLYSLQATTWVCLNFSHFVYIYSVCLFTGNTMYVEPPITFIYLTLSKIHSKLTLQDHYESK